MSIAVLFPRTGHPAIEERYATWQTEMRLRRGAEVSRVEFYDPHESAGDVAGSVEEPHVLVVTDPLVVPSFRAAARLRDALESSGAAAAVPVTNEARHPQQQRVPPAPYLTLRELEDVFEQVANEPSQPVRVTWDESNPALYVCRRETLAGERAQLRRALRGRDVVIDPATYVHVWSRMRGQVRDDLLLYIPLDARSLLELGCGEGGLGALVKQRQKCRVVGIEIDPEASAIARKKIDDVYTGDVRHIVEILHDKFDCIVASEIVEHVDDPWSLLAELRDVAVKGGRLVISVPNLANASVVADLLKGRFDYTYIGLACAGHLRFFTRSSIEDLLEISGWRLESIVPQRAAVTPQAEALMAALKIDDPELLTTGYYVVARNE
jgi:SAM-dependent methyltransferase